MTMKTTNGSITYAIWVGVVKSSMTDLGSLSGSLSRRAPARREAAPSQISVCSTSSSASSVDPKIPDCILDLGVPTQNLGRTKIARRSVNHCGLRASKRVGVQHGRRSRHLSMEGLPNRRWPKADDAACTRVHPSLPAAHRARRLPSHSSLRSACQWSSASEAGPLSKAAQRPAARTAGRRTGGRANSCGTSMPLLRWSHDNHRRVDPTPACLPTSMGRQFMTMPGIRSAQRSASACRAAAGATLWPITPVAHKKNRRLVSEPSQPADRAPQNILYAALVLLPHQSTRSFEARPHQTPSTAAAKSP